MNKQELFNLLASMENNGGATLKKYKSITHKTGWQVATEGQQTTNINKAIEMIEQYEGNCGIWLENGIYYIDKSKRVNTKKEALRIGKECNQISVLKWANMSLAYC